MRKGRLEKHRTDWEDLAHLDPLWAVRAHRERQYGNWDPKEFLNTGLPDVQTLMSHVDRLMLPRAKAAVLDFGCGVGRLAEPLRRHFAHYCGVDISEQMLSHARELTRSVQCNFILAEGDGLPFFRDGSFDLVYSNWVLQHMPQGFIRLLIQEFLRVLKKDGLLVFQLPSHIPFMHRLQLRRRLYGSFRTIGINKTFLYERLGLDPSRMTFVPEQRVLLMLKEYGAKLVEMERERISGHSLSTTYYVTRN